MNDLNIKSIISISNPHKDKISSVQFHPIDNHLLASSSGDKTFKLWRINENKSDYKEEGSYKFHAFGINQIKWNYDGNLIASGGNDFLLNLTDVNYQKLVRNFRMDSNVTCLDINTYSNLILCGTFDKHIALWDVRSKNLIYQILSHSEPITSVSFSPDSTICVSSSYDGFFRFWDVFKGNCLKTIALEKSPPINEIKFLSNNKYVLISSLNNQIQVVDLITEQEVSKYVGHKNSQHLIDMKIISTLNDNIFIISGSEDNKLYVWDVVDGSESRSYAVDSEKSNERIMNCLSLSSSSNLLATSSFCINDLKNKIDISEIIN